MLGASCRSATSSTARRSAGPISRDKLHYFGNFEYEREPRSSIWNTPYPAFNIELNGKVTRKIGGVRLDYQLSQNARLMGKMSGHKSYAPFGGGSATSHPASDDRRSTNTTASTRALTQVLSNRAVNEIKGGYSHFGFENKTLVPGRSTGRRRTGSPTATRASRWLLLQRQRECPRHRDQKVSQVRDDFTYSYEARGRHDLRAGVEFVRPLRGQPELQPVRRQHRRARARSTARHPDAGAAAGVVPGPVQRRHLEFRGDLAVDPHLHDRHRRVPEPVPPAEVRRLGAGRLAHRRQR